jgi:hypothetical protein
MKKSVICALVICALCVSLAPAKSLAIKVSNEKIDAYIAQNPDLPDFDKTCLMNGDFEVGIKTETLRLMLGEPKKITRIRQPWGDQEEWFYKFDGKLYFTIEKGGVVGIEERKK